MASQQDLGLNNKKKTDFKIGLSSPEMSLKILIPVFKIQKVIQDMDRVFNTFRVSLLANSTKGIGSDLDGNLLQNLYAPVNSNPWHDTTALLF